jgi:phenylpyruvate tautomerase PptA (4-oxalocrotonate tautomerase family)
MIRAEVSEWRLQENPDLAAIIIEKLTNALVEALGGAEEMKETLWVVVDGQDPARWGVRGKVWPSQR